PAPGEYLPCDRAYAGIIGLYRIQPVDHAHNYKGITLQKIIGLQSQECSQERFPGESLCTDAFIGTDAQGFLYAQQRKPYAGTRCFSRLSRQPVAESMYGLPYSGLAGTGGCQR